jgi:hypothetical protein
MLCVNRYVTGRIMTFAGGIGFPLASFFANADMARRAIEDVVSNPAILDHQLRTVGVTMSNSPSPNSRPTGYISREVVSVSGRENYDVYLPRSVYKFDDRS